MSRGLYIHVPFCVRKCPYCDFYSRAELSLTEEYTDAVVRNIKHKNIRADTVYFGGGTPSLLTPEQIKRILSAVSICDGAEITAECNPDSASPEYLSGIFRAGVNRVSFGVQSLDGIELKALGRLHDVTGAEAAIKNAYDAGFKNISADIMLGTAFQTKDSLKRTIDALTALPVKHISAYMLKIEPDTPYGRNRKITSLLPDGDETAELYLEAVSLLEKRGLEQYEISNFALPGFESRHNLKYWRCEEYYGIGPSAHSFTDGKRKACPPDLLRFISAEAQEEYVTDDNPGGNEEKTMLALRLTKEGLSPDMYDKASWAEIEKRAAPLITAGFLKSAGGRLTLTPEGCLVSNEIICRIAQ